MEMDMSEIAFELVKTVDPGQSHYSKVMSTCHTSSRVSKFSTPENNYRISGKEIQFSSVKKRVIYNPFNWNLKEKLKNYTCSPTVFSIIVSPNQNSDEFKWTIDELSQINPVPIEEEFIYEDKLDEETEKEIQKTIETYFKETHFITSPWNYKGPQSNKDNESVCSTPVSKYNIITELALPPNQINPMKNCVTENSLNMSCDLSEVAEKSLKPCVLQIYSDDEDYLNVSGFPRKLFFKRGEESLSPVRSANINAGTNQVFASPKNVCYPSTPVQERGKNAVTSDTFSPIDVSPIAHYNFNAKLNNYLPDVSMMQLDNCSNEDDQKMSDGNSFRKRNADSVECSRIFDSPKRIYKSNKRRKTNGKPISKGISSERLFKLHIDSNSATMGMESQDTGYQTDYMKSSYGYQTFRNSNRTNFRNSRSSYKLSCSKYDEENKENYVMVSTPTKWQGYSKSTF